MCTITLLLLLILPFVHPSVHPSATVISDDQTFSTYIIHVSSSEKPAVFSSHRSWYSSTLNNLPHSDSHPAHLLYTYTLAARGFSARLVPSQVDYLRRVPGVVSVLPDQIRHVHTTHTPTFLGLSETSGLWPNSEYAEDVVVGVLDTGIWPERESFSDEGLSPVPRSWKGVCEVGKDFPASACNRKLIGARAFYKGYEAAMGKKKMNETEESKSPRDTDGHGTHTASTAAGSAVPNAGLFEYAVGEARGMATKARIAAYKICWALGCFDSDILAAMDSAVADGVDVISLSVGANGYAPAFYRDSIAIGAFGATQHNVLVSCSAGNSGPGAYTAVNIAPWILTVGASTIDREFPADAILDDQVYGGVSLYSGEPLGDAYLPLVYAGDCGSRLCLPGQLEESKTAGKIVLCDRGNNARVEKGSAVKLAGGAGMILANTAESGEELVADAHLIPATMVGATAGDKIRGHLKSNPNTTLATIRFRGTVIGSPDNPSAPRVAAFSSRGPNYRAPEILKPDVIAPGVNILAAWTGAASPTDLAVDPRRVEFNIISGTSMSCPHASGLAALLRKAHPDWSPAMVKSALMTTAYDLDGSGGIIIDLATGEVANPFVFGAGHVNPNLALNPGLVYDIQIDDYVAFLCTLGYSPQQMAAIVDDKSKTDCSGEKFASAGDLNYPSFSVVFGSAGEVVRHTRTVRNVGGVLDAVYRLNVTAPAGIQIVVSPTELVFSEEKQSVSYTIAFISSPAAGLTTAGRRAFGAVTWTDGEHRVRSPVAFMWQDGLAHEI